MEKLFAILIVLFMAVAGCGMFYGRTVQRAPLPRYALAGVRAVGASAVQPDANELQLTQPITQPVTVSVTLLPAEDHREERIRVFWRLALGVALGLVLCFLVAAVLISLGVG